MKTATIGCMSSGTMRPADLIPDFAWHLRQLVEGDEYAELLKEADEWDADTDEGDGDEILSELFDALDEASPPYCYFGAHPGDGADYGWWIVEDLFERHGPFDGLRVDDLSEVPVDYEGEVLHVNDHGNATLYVATNGKAWRLREVWSTV